MAAPPSTRRIKNPVLFICDLQEKFAPAIDNFPAVLQTTQKLLRASSILNIPVLATTQLRDKLGNTCKDLSLDADHPTAANVDKSAFSMCVPEVMSALEKLPWHEGSLGGSRRPPQDRAYDCIIVGIETHICVLQTAVDLLHRGHHVYVVQDAVSSVNPEERAVALQRCRQEGARVTTSESLIYECLGDAKDEAFKQIGALVKESKDATKESVRLLCKV